MEKHKRITNITTIILLAFGLLASTSLLAVTLFASPAEAKPVSVLLQEGIYAEEIEGDLEAAIKIYKQVVTEAKTAQQTAARATYRIAMCYLKKGQQGKAAEYFQKVTSNYSSQKLIAKKANEQLEKTRPAAKSVFEQIDGQVIRFISQTYGETAGEAGQKNLYANSHIYYVDPNFVFFKGGMGFYYNWTGRTITGKVSLSGTSYPNQTHYDTTGQKLNTEIVQDEGRPEFYHIYWIPGEPLAPGESLYYGWSIDDSRRLPSKTGEVATLTMQNEFGSPVIETFFLVLPRGLKISHSNPPTGSEQLLNFDVYWWTKTVQQGENHVEPIQLERTSPVDDIIARSYVIHYKAIDQAKDALNLLNKNHPQGVRTHHANRYRLEGDLINSICTDTETGKDKIVAAINDNAELELVKVEPPRRVKIRYKMLQEDVEAPGVAGTGANVAKALEMMPVLEALAEALEDAVDDNEDVETGLLLVEKLIERWREFQQMVSGTAAQAPSKTLFDMLVPVRQALEKKQIDRAKLLLETVEKLAGGVRPALEKAAEQQAEILGGGDTGPAKELQESMIKKLIKDMHEPTAAIVLCH